MDNLKPYEFWNKVPGPGPFVHTNYADIPVRLSLEEGMRHGLLHYLGVRWVMESAQPDEIILARTDRTLRVRLHRTYKDRQGGPCFILWARATVPNKDAFAMTVGLGVFRQAIIRELDAEVEYKSQLIPEPEGMCKDLEMLIAIRFDEFPPKTEDGLVSRWFTWSTLALQWTLDALEANPNP
jgi:hypothetical protein